MWMPATLGSIAAALSAASSAARILSCVSVMSVGRSEVVPNLRCAAAIAAIPSTVGSPLKRTSPPPFTWQSMKPGRAKRHPAAQWPAISGGNSRRGIKRKIFAPSITTAQSRRHSSPSKTVEATAAWRIVPFILSSRAGGRRRAAPRTSSVDGQAQPGSLLLSRRRRFPWLQGDAPA